MPSPGILAMVGVVSESSVPSSTPAPSHRHVGLAGQDLVKRFAERLVNDLVENNVLRGAWVEEMVAFFLPGWTFPGAWSYFDLLHPDGKHTLSVKHATGTKPRFGVARKKWAWDNRLAGRDGHEGWRGDDERPAQHWCDVYVFAWLDGPVEHDRVLNVNAWKFAVLSRGAMYAHFEKGRLSVGVRQLQELSGGGVFGHDLEREVNAALGESPKPDVPPLDMRASEDSRPPTVVTASVQQVLELPD